MITPQPGKFSGRRASGGTSMLEVLVTILILTVGMLGLAALQGRAHTSELESYQRGQALILLQDIAGRMEGNSTDAANYVTASLSPAYVGTGATDAADCTTLTSRAQIDLCEWSKAVKGSSETKAGARTGAMIDGRGCVTTTATANVYMLAVVWQGLNKTATPATTCGTTLYDSEQSRRAVTVVFQAPLLTAP